MIRTLPDLLIDAVVRPALIEDMGRAGDITAQACIPAGTKMSAAFSLRQPGVIAGIGCMRRTFAILDERIEIVVHATDGQSVQAGMPVVTVTGDAHAILAGERVALNLIGRLSGIATLTRAYVDAVMGARPGPDARIADTRKMTPGLRALEKHAVICGGGINHRMGLDDAILIKDNHLAVCGGVVPALTRAKTSAGHLIRIELEVDSLAQLDEALELIDQGLGPDVIMLDNFSIADLITAVQRNGGRLKLEASGGVNLQTVRDIAATGVDVISVGALTHSVASLDIGLDVLKT